MLTIRFLGTGTSTGVPEVGCRCDVCCSDDTRDRRLRTSALVDIDDTRLLIDCGPDFRQQMLPLPFRAIDGVLLTHEHYDHVGGLDDLRPFTRFGGVEVYAEKRVCDTLHSRIPYCFAKHPYPGVPELHLHEITLAPFDIAGVTIVPIRVMHAKLPITGFRIGKLAYLTDMLSLPESEYLKLEGLDVLVIDALRHTPHISHQTLEMALEQIARIAPKKAYLTHASHDLGLHERVERMLPENVRLAFDGLTVRI